MKFKRIISTVVAATMALSISTTSAFATDAKFIPTEDGTYKSSEVKAYQYYKPTELSMCNGVFSSEAEVIIDGDEATLRLYVCNPTPKWNGLDDGLLKDAYVYLYEEKYEGTLTTIGQVDGAVNPDAEVKEFSQEQAFFGIESGKSYSCDTMEFKIPTEALVGNELGRIRVETFVNLVMQSTQNFWLDINWIEPTVEPSTPDDTTDTKDVQVSATVVANASTFTVTVPEKIAFGELSTTEDTTVDYNVDVAVVKGNDGAYVEIKSEGGEITDGENKIAFTNNFGTQTADEDTTLSGTLTVASGDIAQAPAGEYTGTVSFEISTIK